MAATVDKMVGAVMKQEVRLSAGRLAKAPRNVALGMCSSSTAEGVEAMSQRDGRRPGQRCCIAFVSCLLVILEASCNQDIDPPLASDLPPVNESPVAVFLARSVDCSELFDFDASMSFDAEDGVEDLQVRWDWEDDGTWDTPWDSVKTVSRRIVDPEQRVRMQVLDGEGATADTVQTLSPPIHTTSVARILAHIGINPCCWLTQPTGCVPCEQHFFQQNYTPGPWSASLHGMTQDSDVAPNWMRMDTSLPSKYALDVVESNYTVHFSVRSECVWQFTGRVEPDPKMVHVEWIVEGPGGQLLEDLAWDELNGQFTGAGILVPGDYRARFAVWARSDASVAMHVVFSMGTPSARSANP